LDLSSSKRFSFFTSSSPLMSLVQYPSARMYEDTYIVVV
jgi:hypothetical protein